jgi:hypothetical protein
MEDPSIEVVENKYPRMGEDKKKEIYNQPELKKIAHLINLNSIIYV